MPAKQAPRWMAPATPVFAGKPAPTLTVQASRSLIQAVACTGMAPALRPCAIPVGAGSPAKQAPRWMAPAMPVFAGMPAPTLTVQASRSLIQAIACTGMAPALRPCAIPVGAGSPAKQAPRWMAPAMPVLAGMPAPTLTVQASRSLIQAIAFTGMAPALRPCAIPVGAGSPAKQAPRWMAPATPVFAGKPAPTVTVQASRSLIQAIACTRMAPRLGLARSLWERVHPRSRRRGGWHRLRRCSRVNPLLHRPCRLQGL